MTKKYIFILIIVSVMLGYSVMYINTNSVIDDFKHIIMGEIVDDDVEKSSFDIYSIKHQTESVVTSANIDIKRIFVLHNFSKGIILVKYSYERYNGDKRINGSWNVFSWWKIEKHSGHWIVTDIREKS